MGLNVEENIATNLYWQKLLREKKNNSKKCIEIARNSETAKIQAAEMAYRLLVPINATKTVDFSKYKRNKSK